MVCDIHWIIERRTTDGAWYVVASADRIFSEREAGGMNAFERDAYRRRPEAAMINRNHALFAELSGVRGVPADGRETLVTAGLPSDASLMAREIFDDDDVHSWGWAPGSAVLAWTDQQRPYVPDYAKAVLAFLESGKADSILAAPTKNDRGRSFADLDGSESGHERMNRLTRTLDLVEWRKDPESWRLIVYYDN